MLKEGQVSELKHYREKFKLSQKHKEASIEHKQKKLQLQSPLNPECFKSMSFRDNVDCIFDCYFTKVIFKLTLNK